MSSNNGNSRVVRCGLIQTKNEVISPAGGTDKKLLEEIKDLSLIHI